MTKKPSDRGLIIIARANIKAAKRDLEENDEVFINFAMFNISQAVEKTLKYLCSCYGIDYDYSHFIVSLIDKLLQKDVRIPQLVQDSAAEYGIWATKSRYTASQLAMRSYVEKHITAVDEWITAVEKQLKIL